MSEILCKWLNQELRLSKTVEPETFAKDFSSGYLIGEILHKYQLQNDFSLFMKKDTSICKLNNFTRLEPTLQLLGISFNTSTAQDLMQEKQGVATHFLYQLYVSLEKKKRAAVSGAMMAMMQPAAIAGLQKKDHGIFSDQMHKVVKHDADLKLQRKKNIEKATAVQVPGPPSYTSKYNLKKGLQQKQRRQQQAQEVQVEIAQFESNRKKLLATPGFASSSSSQTFLGDFTLVGRNQGCEVPGSGTKIILQSNSKYIHDIRQRLEENDTARERRARRTERFLVEQLKAHESQEEARRNEQLVKRLTRQTRQEQRLTAHLLQIRKQKEVILENRLFREQQYQQRRQRDFQEALEREAMMAQQDKLDRAEEIRKELEFLNRIAAEQAQVRYQKHFNICKGILEQTVDLATKVGEYRLLTGNLIPEKLVREWKELLLTGLPLYEPPKGQQPSVEFSTPLDPVEQEKQEIFNNQDYDDYTNMVGEWAWPDEAGAAKVPPSNNNILGHVVQRLRNIVCPPFMKPSSPTFPHFTVKACVLGKVCSGKTTCLAKIAEALGICVLSTVTLVEESLNAYENGKKSTRAMQGEAADVELKKGNIIPNELLLDIIVEAIRKLPAQSGWILDGFPTNITQADLLEKALSGSVDVGNEVESSMMNLASDPNPPKPPLPSAPVLDLALLLDIPDERVVRRAYSHTDKDTATDPTSSTIDQYLYLAQIPHRIKGFQDAWPKLEKWFGGKQITLVCVDADVDKDELYKKVESILKQVLLKEQKDVPDSEITADSSSSSTPPPVDKPPTLKDVASGTMESTSSSNEKKAQSVISPSISNTQSPKGPSRKGSAYSVTNEDSQEVPKNPPESDLHYPGSSNWVYVDLPPENPENLCSFWDTMCESYVNNIKTLMQQLRSQRNDIIHYLFNIREEFKHYIERPVLKQELVSQWQKDFNTIPDNRRQDEEVKVELHERLEDMLERLWDISDKCKEQVEKERAAVMYGWLEDHIAILINHHAVLIQVELDRFKKTLGILKAYYSSMYKQLLSVPLFNFMCLPLLSTAEVKNQDESADPADTSVSSQMDNEEDKQKTKFIFQLPRLSDSPGGVSKTEDHSHMERIKLPDEKLISIYDEALRDIRNLVSTQAHQRETKEQNERDRSIHHNQEVIKKIHEEYSAALNHEENAVKVRIALVKGHGLGMVQCLQTRAEETLNNMDKCLEAHYLRRMKSIDQLSHVVHQHIEAGAKLQNELLLESTEFYMYGDHLMVATSISPPSSPPLEKPTVSTMTITQLELLHQQLYNTAPSGSISSFEFFRFLKNITFVNTKRSTFPDPWINKNKTQENVAMLRKLIDWRQFLLSSALPWPVPSITELLVVLHHFKAVDTGNTGYINEEQYLQTELWFSRESVQHTPDFDYLDNLRKFFFWLFADHCFSPPRLDYVSMLQYFAADPDPRQGFIRALSVVLGKHLKQSSPGQLVKSMPCIETDAELNSSEHDKEYKEEETLCASSSSLGDQEVSVSALLAVICHKTTNMKPGCLNQEEYAEHVCNIYQELGYKPEDCIPFSILSQHPYIHALMETSTQYQLINIQQLLLAHQDEEDAEDMTVSKSMIYRQ